MTIVCNISIVLQGKIKENVKQVNIHYVDKQLSSN